MEKEVIKLHETREENKRKKEEALKKARAQMPNYHSRSDEIHESYLSRKWHFEH